MGQGVAIPRVRRVLVLGSLAALAVLAAAREARAAPDEATVRDNEDFRNIEIGDPECGGNGAYSFRFPLLDLGGPMNLRFEVVYRSDQPQYRPEELPQRFRASAFVSACRLVPPTGPEVAGVQLPDGRVCSFRKSGTDWALATAADEPG